MLQVWDLTTGELVRAAARPGPRDRPAGRRLGPGREHAGAARRGSARLDDDSLVAEVTKAGPRPLGMAVTGSILAVARAGRGGAARPGDRRSLARLDRADAMAGAGAGHHRRPAAPGDGFQLRPGPAVGSDGRRPRRRRRHADPITAAAFAPGHDGEVLVTGDTEGTLRRWRGRDGHPAGPPLADRTGPVRALAAWRDADRTVLATAGGDVNYRPRRRPAAMGPRERHAHRPGVARPPGRDGPRGPGRDRRSERIPSAAATIASSRSGTRPPGNGSGTPRPENTRSVGWRSARSTGGRRPWSAAQCISRSGSSASPTGRSSN